MIDISIHDWTDALWKYFGPQIKSGNPVYFSIDSDLLKELIEDILGDSVDDNGLYVLANSCEKVLEFERHRVFLRDDKLTLDSSHFSSAICLVALFVGAVELMTPSESYTEDAYFPILRRLLNVDEGDYLSSNPFLKYEFEKIWNKFREEIMNYPGGSARTITFHKGRDKKNFHRELPLSQALLTAYDLWCLYKNNETYLESLDEETSFLFLRKNRSKLSTRANRIISHAVNNEERKLRLSRQLMAFVQSPSFVHERYQSKENTIEGSFEAFRAASNMFSNDGDSVNIYFSNDSIPLDRAAHRYCNGGRCIFLMEENRVFSQKNTRCKLESGDTFLIITQKESYLNIVHVFERATDKKSSLEEVETNLGSNFKVFLGSLDVLPLYDVFYSYGKISFGAQERQTPSLTLSEGSLLDGRRKQYLSPFAPQRIFYNGKEIAENSLIEVNGEETSYKNFMAMLKMVSPFSNAFYEISFEQSKVEFELYSSITHETLNTLLGFPFEGKLLQPFVDFVDANERALFGFELPRRRTVFPQSKRRKNEVKAAVLLLMKDWSEEVLQALSKPEVDYIYSKLNEFRVPKKQQEVIGEKLNKNQAIPIISWKYIFKSDQVEESNKG